MSLYFRTGALETPRSVQELQAACQLPLRGNRQSGTVRASTSLPRPAAALLKTRSGKARCPGAENRSRSPGRGRREEPGPSVGSRSPRPLPNPGAPPRWRGGSRTLGAAPGRARALFPTLAAPEKKFPRHNLARPFRGSPRPRCSPPRPEVRGAGDGSPGSSPSGRGGARGRGARSATPGPALGPAPAREQGGARRVGPHLKSL